MSLALAPADHLIVHGQLSSAEQRAVQRGAERGHFVRVRRGVFISAETWGASTEQQRALLRVHALAVVSGDPPVFSHWSAALLHGLPVPYVLQRSVHRTIGGDHAASQPAVVTHLGTVPACDVVEIDGLLVTAPARTAVDIAALATFDLGVVAVDATLRLLGRGTEEGRGLLLDAWRRGGPRRAVRKVEAAVGFGDASSESAAESRSRVTMRRLGLPRPVLQREFSGRAGFVARVDFWFPDEHVVGEVDGKIKYFDAAMTRGDPAAVHYAEKLRDEALRELGETPVHWGWREAIDAGRLGPRLSAVGVRAG